MTDLSATIETAEDLGGIGNGWDVGQVMDIPSHATADSSSTASGRRGSKDRLKGELARKTVVVEEKMKRMKG